MKRKSNLTTKILAVLLIAFAAIVIITVFIGGYLENQYSQSSLPELIISACDVLVAGVAALFIVIQLKGESDNKMKQYQTEQARFLLEYNHAFITNQEMTQVERDLECDYLGRGKPTLDFYDEEKGDRQKLINYLVYLEGFAACVLNGLLELDTIDDLFAYRFFLAMNSPIAQEVEIKPFAIYYRGSLKLYAKWYLYRKNKWSQWDHVDYGIPQMEHSIHQWEQFEEFVENPVRVIRADSAEKKWIALVNGEKAGYYTGFHSGDKGIEADNVQLMGKWEGTETGYWIKNALLKMIKQDISCNTEIIQLKNGCQLTEIQLKEIARLVYETDPYIYPAMFGGIEEAKSIIPKLLKEETDSMFSLNNLCVAVIANEVIGVLLWHKGILNWNSQAVLEQARILGIKLNEESLDKAEKEYVQNTYEEIQKDIFIINLCIKKELQGYGLGYILLQQFVEWHSDEQMELCVLADNYGAIKLYKRCGFEIIGEIREGFSLEVNKPDCVDMKRSVNEMDLLNRQRKDIVNIYSSDKNEEVGKK